MSNFPRPAAFFDRDGVLNVDHGYVGRPREVELILGAAAAIIACRATGLMVFIVTNQSGVARGFFDEGAVRRVHGRLLALLADSGAAIDDLRYCPHHPEGTVAAYRRTCACRKPAPGMILDLARAWNIDLAASFLVGDKASDVAAATAAGVPGHLFKGGDLAAFVRPILAARA